MPFAFVITLSGFESLHAAANSTLTASPSAACLHVHVFCVTVPAARVFSKASSTAAWVSILGAAVDSRVPLTLSIPPKAKIMDSGGRLHRYRYCNHPTGMGVARARKGLRSGRPVRSAMKSACPGCCPPCPACPSCSATMQQMARESVGQG